MKKLLGIVVLGLLLSENAFAKTINIEDKVLLKVPENFNYIKIETDEVADYYNELFIHDDLWISYFLFFIKRIKILSLQKYLKIKEDGKRKTIYEIHNTESTLLSSYGSNMIDAVRERDKRAINSIKYMQEKTKKLNF